MVPRDEHKEHEEHREITTETLSTPPVQIKPAPLSVRIAAGLVDSLILAVAWTAMMLRQDFTALGMVSLNSIVYLAILVFAYYFVSEGVFAATVGKSMLRLRVLGKEGEPCSIGAAFKRNLLRFVDWLPFLYILAVVSILASTERRRIGDRFAGTIVSRAPEKDINPPPAPFLFH